MREYIPIIYLYIYRNLLKESICHYISKEEVFKIYKKVLRRAPASVYFKLTKELEEFDLIQPMGNNGFRVCQNKVALNKVKKLNDFIFTY